MSIPESVARAVVLSGQAPEEAFVMLTVLFPPATDNLEQLLDELGTRLKGLAPLILTGGVQPDDPRLNLSLDLVEQLEPPPAIRDAIGPTWLETAIRELLELRTQLRDVATPGLGPPKAFSLIQHLKLAKTILEHDRDESGDIRYALHHLITAIRGIAAVVGS